VALFASRAVFAVVGVVEAAVVGDEISADVVARRTAHVRRPTGVALAVVRVTGAAVVVEIAEAIPGTRNDCAAIRIRCRRRGRGGRAEGRLRIVATHVLTAALRHCRHSLQT